MGVLDQITQMKRQGIPDEEIVRNLQEKGVSPREINDALNQTQIKNAVSDYPEQDMTNYPPQGQNQMNYSPRTQEVEQETYPPGTEQEYYPQESYQDEYNYPAEGGFDNNTIIEISEQVFSEKIKKIQKKIDEIDEFKALAQTKIESATERLKRIESVIDKLQVAILERIGSYGKNIESIKKEMSMMQDSFGKVVNQAVKGHHVKTSSQKSTSRKNISKKK